MDGLYILYEHLFFVGTYYFILVPVVFVVTNIFCRYRLIHEYNNRAGVILWVQIISVGTSSLWSHWNV